MLAHIFAGALVVAIALPAPSPAEASVASGLSSSAKPMPDAKPVPDIVVPGTRGVSVTVRCEDKALSDHCCVQHVVKDGETLSKIAVTHCGNVAGVKEILALNPGLDPDKLKIGQRFWLPPKVAPKDPSKLLFAYAFSGWPFSRSSVPYAPTDQVQYHRYGSFVWMLVPRDKLQAFAEAMKDEDLRAAETFIKKPEIQVLKVNGSSGRVRDEDPTDRIADTITFKRDDKGVFSVDFQSVAYDKQGKVVPPGSRHKKRESGMLAMWLLLLPLVGGSWLMMRARRQQKLELSALA